MKTKPASMRVAKTKENEKKETPKCGECRLMEWNEENRDWQGKMFYGYCIFMRPISCSKPKGVVYPDTPACEHFDEKGGAK